jgi:acyl dehydratase
MAGFYYEEFQVGQVFDHPAALHLDEEYCREHTEFGQRVVNSCLTLSLMVGISVNDTTLGTTVANLGWDEVRFPKPLFHGDTLHVRTEVLERRDSRSRPHNGIVIFEHRAFNQRDELVGVCKAFNQRDELVGVCKRTALMLRRPGT